MKPNKLNLNLNFWTKCSLVNWILTQFEAFEQNSLLILRVWRNLWFGGKNKVLRTENAEIGSMRMTSRLWKGIFRTTHTCTPFFSECPFQHTAKLMCCSMGHRSIKQFVTIHAVGSEKCPLYKIEPKFEFAYKYCNCYTEFNRYHGDRKQLVHIYYTQKEWTHQIN